MKIGIGPKKGGMPYNMGMKWIRLVLALVGLLAVAAVVLFFTLQPQVVSFRPEMIEGGVSRFSAVEITFSREMRAADVEDLLEITPAIPGAFTWEGNTLRFTPEDGWPAGAEVLVRLLPGAKSRLGLGMREETNWTFTVSPVMLAYLWPSEGSADIYLLGLESGQVGRLTETGGVVSFSVDPTGLRFYFFAANTLGGSDLYMIDRFSGEAQRLLTCQRAQCTEAAVSPQGGWLAYLRNEAEIWVLPLAGGDASQVSAAWQTANFPLWAAEGILSYYDFRAQEFIVHDLDTGREIESWQNMAGELGDWLPGGGSFAAPEFFEVETDLLRGPTGEESNQEVDESELQPVWVTSSQLQRYTLGEWQPASLTDEELAEDYAPAFSPDGTRLVFTRRYLDEERWTPGRQVWLMAASGGQRRQLTDAPDYEYSALRWHPDGERLAAVRFNVTLLTEPPEIWLLELSGGAVRLVIDGYAPQWVP